MNVRECIELLAEAERSIPDDSPDDVLRAKAVLCSTIASLATGTHVMRELADLMLDFTNRQLAAMQRRN